MIMDTLKRNIDAVLAVALQAGKDVTVVAATKTVPPDIINMALDCGVTDVGENRVQEYLAKRDAVKGAKWHFIGTLQTNKVKYLVGNVALIQSVSSCALVDEISRLCVKKNVTQDVLIEVNAADEVGKTGAPTDRIYELAEYADRAKGVRVCGLMAVPPKDSSDGVYRGIRDLYEALRATNKQFNILSVGMSNDYERAIYYGSNMIRIGSAIFGKRG